MATITLYADRINQMPAGLRSVRTAVDAFRENVDTLRISVVAIDSSICNLDDIISSLRASSDTQEMKADTFEDIADDTEEFIETVISIDEDAAEAITSSKEDFYDDYYYLKTDSEKTDWEIWRDNACEWCRDHWKEIVLTVVIVVGVVLTVAAVIASGGLALVPLLTALGVSASAAATISMAVAVIAVSSAIISGVLNVGSLWGGFQSEGWQKFRTVMNWVSCISNLTYSVGMLYNGLNGISNEALKQWDANRLIPVTRWGREGLFPNDWVMRGGKNHWNYFWSGKWQPGFGNEFAPYSSGVTYWVPKGSIHLPTGGTHIWDKGAFAVLKWLIGQFKYM